MLLSDAVTGGTAFASAALDAELDREGFVTFDFLEAGAVDDTQAFFDSLDHPAYSGFHATVLHPSPAYRRAVDAGLRARFEAPLRELLPGYRIAFASFAVKAPNAPAGRLGLHQDITFVDEDRHTTLGLWCPLLDVDWNNGCLFAVRGSHRVPTCLRGPRQPFPFYEHARRLLDEFAEPLPIPAGGGFIQDQRLFHGSPPNLGSTLRVAAAAVLVPDNATLRYCHLPDPSRPHLVEVFEVDDDFYFEHTLGRRPARAKLVATIEKHPAPLNTDLLIAPRRRIETDWPL